MSESQTQTKVRSSAPSHLLQLLVITAVQETKLFATARTDEVVTDVAISLGTQIDLLPKSLRVAVSIAIRLFNLEPIIFHGRTFKGLPEADRIAHLKHWENSRIAVKRDFIRFIRSTVLFNFYDHPDVRSRI